MNTSFGRHMEENVNERAKKDLFERYLVDFVSMTIKVSSDDELEVRVIKVPKQLWSNVVICN